MGPKEIAVEYRTAANKQKQIKVLAELNQCAERRIAEILDAEGEELPKKWQAQLQKPERRSRKFPEGEATPDDDAPAPVSPSDRATDRDLFEVDGVGPVSASDHHRYMVRVSFSPEELLRAACRMLTSALDLEPEKYHVYSCGVLDLVHALTEEV